MVVVVVVFVGEVVVGRGQRRVFGSGRLAFGATRVVIEIRMSRRVALIQGWSQSSLLYCHSHCWSSGMSSSHSVHHSYSTAIPHLPAIDLLRSGPIQKISALFRGR